MREAKIYNELLKRAKEIRSKGNWQFDLDMKNGEEITIYLPGQPIIKNHNSEDFSILTDDNKVIHFNTLSEIAEYLNKMYK